MYDDDLYLPISVRSPFYSNPFSNILTSLFLICRHNKIESGICESFDTLQIADTFKDVLLNVQVMENARPLNRKNC